MNGRTDPTPPGVALVEALRAECLAIYEIIMGEAERIRNLVPDEKPCGVEALVGVAAVLRARAALAATMEGGPGTVAADAYHDDAPLLGALQHVERLQAMNRDLHERNDRMRGFIQRLGYGHTDWPEHKSGCAQPGPGCPGVCIARCEDPDNLHLTIAGLRDELASARVPDAPPEATDAARPGGRDV